jgi:hypothetical protein
MGMGLPAVASGLRAFQTIVVEELFRNVDASGEEIVSVEGLCFPTFVALPLANILLGCPAQQMPLKGFLGAPLSRWRY